jgi:peptide/nickel transport system permease protein
VKVTDALMQRLPTTVSLTAVSALIAIIVGLAAGIAAALRPRSLVDRFATLGATFGQAVPNFWFGLLLAAIFAVGLRWFPATGFTPITQSPWDWLRSVTLPALALGLASSAAIARQVRSAMVGVLQQDYIRAARAQGLSKRRVIFKHALKNALVPVVAVLSFQITVLLGGALIVEQVFAINGLGTLAITAVRRQDIPMIQGLVLVMVGLVVIVQLATDLIYGYLNPKARPS